MEGAVILSLVILAMGAFFCCLAVLGWRHPSEDSISLLEAGILAATGEEPLPLTRFDRALQRFQLVMMTIFGPLMVLVGGFGFLSEIGAL